MISVVYPFFNHHTTLEHHLKTWNEYPHSLKDKLQFILVDDCSYNPLQLNWKPYIDLEIYRVDDDIIWNYGAKNLGIQKAKHEWFLLSELDHWMSQETCEQILELKQTTGCYYMFGRRGCSERSDPRYSEVPHPATMYMSKTDFNMAGGIDEDFSGHYGYDDNFLMSCLKHIGCEQIVKKDIIFINHSDNIILPDADLKKDLNVPRDRRRNKKLLQDKLKHMIVSEQKIRFKWHKAYP
jgi:hypothetical protein